MQHLVDVRLKLRQKLVAGQIVDRRGKVSPEGLRSARRGRLDLQQLKRAL